MVQFSLDLFTAAAHNRVRIFLILFCLTLAARLVIEFGRQLRYFKTNPTRIYGPPPRVLGIFPLPPISVLQFTLFGVVMILSLVAATLNFAPRVFLLISVFCYFPYFNSIMSLATVQRKTNLLPVVLLVLVLAPGIGAPLIQPEPTWPLVLVKLALAQMYLSAGLQKLRNGGLKWLNGSTVRAYLVEHYLWGETKSALWLAQQPRLCIILSSLLLIFELTFWLIIPFPSLTLVLVVAGLAFHVGILLTMRINYLKYLGPVYMIFLPDIVVQLRHAFGG